MSVEISRETFNYTQEKCTANIQYISDCDIIVPDSKPDVLKILEVSAYEQINEKSISRDYITLSGIINHNILYISDDDTNSLNHIEYAAPFSRQIPAGGASDDSLCKISSSIVHTEHSIHNSRKLNVKCAVNISASAYKNDDICVVTAVDDLQSMPCKSKTVNAYNVCSITEHTFHMDEMCQALEHAPISEIVKYRLTINDSEVKTVANKAVVKGDVSVRVLYLSDGVLNEAISELPFTQIIDMDSLNSDMNVNAEFCLKNISVHEELDTDATMSQFNVQADVGVIITLSDEKPIQYISDIYSPDFEISVQSSDLCIYCLEDTVSSQCIVNDSLRLENGDVIGKVYTLDAKAYAEEANVSDNCVSIKGYVNASILYSSDSEEMLSVYKQIPFSCELPLTQTIDGKNVKCICDVDTESSSYNIDSANSVNIREVLKIHCNLISENTVAVINDIDFDVNKKIDKSNQAGITVYFVQSGDSMWDIAKRYHTTESEILSINKLEDSFSLSAGQQLLIPKRY